MTPPKPDSDYYGQAEEMWPATFADPDGNYFQLATPWDQPSK